ncbi:MAG: glycosyltransferase family 39 protein [Caulobacterales bacterium]|nr:glycosyltransferase family 39 protein [Caulobacterales bacterium]
MDQSHSPQWRTLIILALLAAAAGWAGLASLPPLDRDEARYAQASAQMLESGDFVRIRYLDQPRHKKPVGIHWLQAGAVSAFSHVDARAIWAYRLPSLMGAVLAVLATYVAGAMLLGRGPAAMGAALLGVSVLLGAEAGIAKTDAVLAGFTALVMAGLAGLYCGKSRRYALVFWGALGCAFLVKGPVAPMTAGLAITTLAAIDRRANWLRALAWWPGPLLAFALAAPWVIVIQRATDGAFLLDAFTADLAPKLVSAHETHAGWPLFHSTLLPVLFWPGVLFLLPGLALAGLAFVPRICARANDLRRVAELGLSEAARSAALRFLAAWALPTWLVFEIAPTKLVHYTLPAFPALALMAGLAAHWLIGRAPPAFGALRAGALYTVALLAIPAFLAAAAIVGEVNVAFPLIAMPAAVMLVIFTRDGAAARGGPRVIVDLFAAAWMAGAGASVIMLPLPVGAENALAGSAGFALAFMIARRTPAVEALAPGLVYTSALLSVLMFVAVSLGLAGGVWFLLTAPGPWNGASAVDITLTTFIDAAPAGATRTWALATAGIALLVLAGLVLRGMPRAAVAAACMAGLAWQWGARGHVVPQLHALFVSDAISQELEALSLHPRRSAGAKPPLVATGFTEPSLAFLTASTTVLADPRRAAFLIAEQAGRAAVVEDGARTAFERALEEVGADAISLGDVSGFNYSKGRPVTVWIYRTTHEAAPEALTRARAALADEMRP